MVRGVRNNNPLNIRLNRQNKWKGAVLVNTDGEFEQFVDMVYGFRAAFRLLRNYISRYKCNTIRKIISRWAPESDGNNTERYIQRVCGETYIGGNEALQPYDPRLVAIVKAMAKVECGDEIKPYLSYADTAWGMC